MGAGVRRGENQKLKMLWLAKIFSEETDDAHALTMAELIGRLAAAGVSADRKTLYQDLEELRRFGLDILAERTGRECRYHLASRTFELPELKLLVDSVQASRFITEKKSRELIGKLESLASRHEAKQLSRQVVLSGRIKSMNESIYYNVDRLHEAIASDRRIRFRYFRWNMEKKEELRRGGAWYEASPWGLLWNAENYYLVAYDSDEARIKHYRVDKMLRIQPAEGRREGRKAFRAFDLAGYAGSLFGMFSGEEARVTLLAENEMIGILIDRFGKDIPVIPKDEGHFETVVRAAVSGQFFGWAAAFGGRIRITGPKEVEERMREEIRRLAAAYGV